MREAQAGARVCLRELGERDVELTRCRVHRLRELAARYRLLGDEQHGLDGVRERAPHELVSVTAVVVSGTAVVVSGTAVVRSFFLITMSVKSSFCSRSITMRRYRSSSEMNVTTAQPSVGRAPR